jgi:type IV pilus assembly protein PilQ
MRGSLARSFSMGVLFFLLSLGQTSLPCAQTRISIAARHADVRETLRMITEMGGLDVVIGPDVTGTVTLRLQDVPVEDALQTVLNTAGLVQVREGKTIGILSREAWLQRQRQQAELQILGRARTRLAIVPLHYAKAAELAPLLATLLSPWGTIAVDERTNSLVIRDIPESPMFQQPRVIP